WVPFFLLPALRSLRPLSLAPKPRSISDTEQYPLRTQKSANRLTPGFFSRRHQQLVPLRFQLLRGALDIHDIELKPGLRNRQIFRPLTAAEARFCRLRKRPQRELLYPFDLV